jgi:hypothetical protein
LASLVLKKIKEKFVSQCEAIVKDNVPIKYREWKGKLSNPYVVPDLVKDQPWNDVLKHFTLPEGVDANLVKGWTLAKMATQFQNFKKKLTRGFIKNNRTPNWDEYPKIKDHWKSLNTRKVKFLPKKVPKGSTTIVLVEVVTR